MNIPTIGQKQPEVQPGITLNTASQGNLVVVQILSNLILEPEQAEQLIGAIQGAIIQAKMNRSVLATVANGNGAAH